MAHYPPPYPPPPVPPYGNDRKYQRQQMRNQERMQREAFRAQRDMYRAQVRGLRRSSIVGPLLVIGVGVVFLLVQTGRLHAPNLWTWYGRWWPYLLIGVGVIRLAEWGIDQMTQRDLPANGPRARRTMGGGVVTLLILLAVAGVVFSAARNHGELFNHGGFSINPDNIDEFLGDKHESDQTLSHACSPNGTVTVENPRGDVQVSGTSDDGQIHVSVHKELYTRSDSEAQTRAQHLAPQFDATDGGVTVMVPAVEGGRADLVMTVPATVTVAVNANRGDVRVNGTKAAVSVTANHGDIDLNGLHGTVSAHINNGDSSFSAHAVTGPLALEGRGKDLTISDVSGPVSMSGEFFGTTHLEHVQGTIRFHTSRTDLQLARLDGELEISPNADLSADQAAGPMMLNTRNRNITLERISGELAVTNRNGSVDLTVAPPMGNVTVENRNGSVNVTLPNGAGFVVQAETANGEVENEFSLPTGGTENHPSMAGEVGKGGPLLRVSTSQGDVSLKKGNIAPLPPSAPPAPPRLTTMPEGMEEGLRQAEVETRRATEEAARQLKQAQDQVQHANREAADAQRQAQREAQRKIAEAQRELERAQHEQEQQTPK